MTYYFRPMFPVHNPYGFLEGCYDKLAASRGWEGCNLCENCYRLGQCTTPQNETAKEKFRRDQEERKARIFTDKRAKQSRIAA